MTIWASSSVNAQTRYVAFADIQLIKGWAAVHCNYSVSHIMHST